MEAGYYLWHLMPWRKAPWYPPYAADKEALEQEIAKARELAQALLQHAGIGGTPIDIDKMVAEPYEAPVDYAGRPWENDAFFTETVAGAYWDSFDGRLLHTLAADQCSPAYDSAASAPERLARIAREDKRNGGE